VDPRTIIEPVVKLNTGNGRSGMERGVGLKGRKYNATL